MGLRYLFLQNKYRIWNVKLHWQVHSVLFSYFCLLLSLTYKIPCGSYFQKKSVLGNDVSSSGNPPKGHCQGHRPILSHRIKALGSQIFADKTGILGSLYSQGREIGSSRGQFICIILETYFREKTLTLCNCLLLLTEFKARVISSNTKV